MSLVCAALWAAVVASWAYRALTVLGAARFRCMRRMSVADRSEAPATILKPLCGLDHGLDANLRSFLVQDYPEYQVVFVAAEETDPALAVAQDAVAACPGTDAVIVSGSPPIGRNAKVANLAHALRSARNPLIVISDSDMRVTPDYLRQVTAPLSDPAVGVVTCLYRLTEAYGLAARLEALWVGADFIPSVLAAWVLDGAKFGFGSTLAVRREALDRSGGFEALADELADDYRLAERIRSAGFREDLSSYVVECPIGRVRFGDMWARRIRWARTIRSLQPAGYAGSLVTHGVPLAIALALVCRTPAAWAALAISLLLRVGAAAWTAHYATGDQAVLRTMWLIPLSDCVGLVVWALGLGGSRVHWRGRSVAVP
jgi:ceramide glucosyltransferase